MQPHLDASLDTILRQKTGLGFHEISGIAPSVSKALEASHGSAGLSSDAAMAERIISALNLSSGAKTVPDLERQKSHNRYACALYDFSHSSPLWHKGTDGALYITTQSLGSVRLDIDRSGAHGMFRVSASEAQPLDLNSRDSAGHIKPPKGEFEPLVRGMDIGPTLSRAQDLIIRRQLANEVEMEVVRPSMRL